MPVTPFHFGPGVAIHAVSPEKVSFIAFCVANVIVDVEPLYYMIMGRYPFHRFFHTYVGVSLVVALTICILLTSKRFSSRLPLLNKLGWKNLKTYPIILGAVLGGYSHIALDSIMHADIRPLSPFSEENVLYQFVSLNALHWICLSAGIIGIVVVGVRQVLERKDMV